jgi:hypothetical protein
MKKIPESGINVPCLDRFNSYCVPVKVRMKTLCMEIHIPNSEWERYSTDSLNGPTDTLMLHFVLQRLQ